MTRYEFFYVKKVDDGYKLYETWYLPDDPDHKPQPVFTFIGTWDFLSEWIQRQEVPGVAAKDVPEELLPIGHGFAYLSAPFVANQAANLVTRKFMEKSDALQFIQADYPRDFEAEHPVYSAEEFYELQDCITGDYVNVSYIEEMGPAFCCAVLHEFLMTEFHHSANYGFFMRRTHG